MVWEVKTLGGGAITYDVFNAVAALTASQNYLNMVSLFAMIGMFWALMVTAFGNSFIGFVKWFATIFLVYNIVFLPKASVVIRDPIFFARPVQSVDNVPLVLAILASMSTSIGGNLTEMTEAVFSTPDDLKYHKSGMLFGSRLLLMASSAKIADSNISSSISSFVRQCVFYDILLHRISMEELVNSDDIWKLISSQPSVSRSFELRSAHDRKILTCKSGINELQKLLDHEVTQSEKYFDMVFGNNMEVNAVLKRSILSALPTTYNTFLGISKSSKELIKQNMLINAIDSAGAEFSGIGSNSNIYTDIRSNIQTRAAFKANAKQAEEYLPYLRVVLEILIYGLFPFAFLIFLLPGGNSALSGYVAAFVWLQTWAPMYALLNRIMIGIAGAKTKMISASSGLTIATHSGIISVNEGIADMAGYLAWSIPFLSAGLVSGLVTTTKSLATSILSVPQNAINIASGEVATGNISLGNVSVGNYNFDSFSANKISEGITVDSGRMQVINSMGGSTSMNAFGEYSSNQMGAISSIPNFSLKFSEMVSSQLLKSASRYENLGESMAENASISKGKALEETIQVMFSEANSQTNYKDVAENMSVSERESFSKIINSIEEFAKTNNIEYSNSKELILSAGATGSLPFISIGGSGKLALGSRSSELETEAERYVEQEGLANEFNIIKDMVERRGVNDSITVSESSNQNISESLKEYQSYEKQSRQYYDKADSLRSESQNINSNSMVMDREYTDRFVKWASTQNDINGYEIGHDRIVRILTSPLDSDRVVADRLIQDFLKNLESELLESYSKSTVIANEMREIDDSDLHNSGQEGTKKR